MEKVSSLTKALMAVAVISLPVLPAGRFLLQSELFTNRAASPAVSTLTWYDYDPSGNLTVRRGFTGADTLTSLSGRAIFSYNPDGTLAQELLLDGTDTLSIVRYGYAANQQLRSVVTMDKAQSVQFSDSLLYDGTGRCAEMRRFVSGVMTFYRAYTYDVNGNKLTDSLFEKTASGYDPTQAVLFRYDGLLRNDRQSNYRNSSGTWYLINTAVMTYTGDNRTSAALYQGDGAGGVLEDSLAYTYDANGNRIWQGHYDDERTLVSTIDYVWKDTQTFAWETLRGGASERTLVRCVVGARAGLNDTRERGYTALGRMAVRSADRSPASTILLVTRENGGLTETAKARHGDH